MGRVAKNLGDDHVLRLGILPQSNRPLIGSSTVATLTSLVGMLGGGAATGSMFPERDATKIPEEVDGPPAEEYGGGLAT